MWMPVCVCVDISICVILDLAMVTRMIGTDTDAPLAWKPDKQKCGLGRFVMGFHSLRSTEGLISMQTWEECFIRPSEIQVSCRGSGLISTQPCQATTFPQSNSCYLKKCIPIVRTLFTLCGLFVSVKGVP